MRYRCHRCDSLVKDKFLFGLWHVCLTDEEWAWKQEMLRQQQSNSQHYMNVVARHLGLPGAFTTTGER